MPRIFATFSHALHAIFTPALLNWRIDLSRQDKDEAMLPVQCPGHKRQVCGTCTWAVLKRRILTWLDSLFLSSRGAGDGGHSAVPRGALCVR